MAALAFKAIDYGAEQIPDKFFEKIPGGYFTPEEKKKNRAARKKHQDEKRREEEPRRSRRDRSPPTDYSSYSDRESDYERERRRRDRQRTRSLSRGRDHRSKDLNRDLDGRDMAYAEQGQSSGPYFPPPPTSEYRQYNPQDHSSRPGHDDYRSSSAMPTYGYPPQPAASQPYPSGGQRTGTSPVAYGEEAAHRYETIQNAKASQAQQPNSYTASRYTPGPGYAPSPVAMPQASIPPPPVGVNSPPVASNTPYAPYDPSTYASSYNPATYGANGNARSAQPPFYRHNSRSQPSVVESNSAYPVYAPRNSDQVAQYDYPPSSRRSSTKPDRREERHRARSADSRNDRNRENSRMSDLRGRFDDMDMQKKGLAAAVGGALAGGFAGRALGGKSKTSRLTTLAGVAAGALGGQAIANRTGENRSRDSRRSPSRSRSRHRKRDDREKSRERSRSRSRGLRARSRSIVNRFRSKSRGRDDRDMAPDRDRGSRRPDRGYEVKEEYESFTESDSEGSPVRRHRRRTKRKEY